MDAFQFERLEQCGEVPSFNNRRVIGKNLDVEIDNLYVKSAIANEGPRMKRIRPAPQGRAYRYQRRIAHIIVILAERGKSSETGARQTR